MDKPKIVSIPQKEREVTAQTVATKLMEEDLEEVLVLGWTKDGNLYRGWSFESSAEALEIIEVLKHLLLDAYIYGEE